MVTLDVEERLLSLGVDDEELKRRKQAWVPPERLFERGYGSLYSEHIGQADKGCDFDFLARSGAAVEPDPG
jgi:dihydroxy-acid dehydratase